MLPKDKSNPGLPKIYYTLGKWKWLRKKLFHMAIKRNFTYLKNEILCELEPLIPSSDYRDKYPLSEESYKKSCESFAEIYVAILVKVSFQSVFYFWSFKICFGQKPFSVTRSNVQPPSFFFYQNNSQDATNKFTIR